MRINNNIECPCYILLYNSMCNALNIQSPCTYNQCLGICVSFTRTGLFYLATMSKESGTKWQHQSHLARTLNIPFLGSGCWGRKWGPDERALAAWGLKGHHTDAHSRRDTRTLRQAATNNKQIQAEVLAEKGAPIAYLSPIPPAFYLVYGMREYSNIALGALHI